MKDSDNCLDRYYGNVFYDIHIHPAPYLLPSPTIIESLP